ncbi:iron-sulfur cluster co-chaperone mitochondrial [Raphidocelis subcapitata]|uniref:Iron-sulfur cluster co-chaperone mitochondrial n=1 Tax=Raphidocelis subcapitata TaxID=307507 RepID=A0A2V0NML5_9CHLO|nr:iron-sulfur cluster co-chaperone mitochondrial [Raphidocelis subcapitata]|eukprot:GBF88744.1 iron-sulfur cluster co-chaperone mitochondrial [Raphidocelis subcapitata]
MQGPQLLPGVVVAGGVAGAGGAPQQHAMRYTGALLTRAVAAALAARHAAAPLPGVPFAAASAAAAAAASSSSSTSAAALLAERAASHLWASSSRRGAHFERGSDSFEEAEASCWSCHDRHKRGSLLCQSCDKIQPADSSQTYFDLMGIREPTFDIDTAALERRYKLLQWTLHPDKSVARTPQEQGFSAEHASHVNQAYGVLRKPLSRANYLLSLAGVQAGDNFEGTIEDPELLMEVMEAREQVEATDDPRELAPLLDSARARQSALEARLSEAFRARDTGAAAALVAQLTYYVRLEEAITAKM